MSCIKCLLWSLNTCLIARTSAERIKSLRNALVEVNKSKKVLKKKLKTVGKTTKKKLYLFLKETTFVQAVIFLTFKFI